MAPVRLVILVPILDDWRALALLIPRISAAVEQLHSGVGLLVVDDGSTTDPAEIAPQLGPGSLEWLRVLRLKRNLGHQRAIAVGLCYIEANVSCEQVVVMDGDGEDRPEDLADLLARAAAEHGRHIVFAERRRRVEGLGFRTGYAIYRLLHRVLTGRGVSVGNFSVIPWTRLESLTVVSELWIHYAAAVVRSRQPWSTLPLARGRRLDGTSRMNLVALVVHGLSAISVFADVVFTRLLVGTAVLMAVSGAALAMVVGTRLWTPWAAPGWATYSSGLIAVVLVQSITFAASLAFLVLGARQQAPVIPKRDYDHFIAGLSEIGRAAE